MTDIQEEIIQEADAVKTAEEKPKRVAKPRAPRSTTVKKTTKKEETDVAEAKEVEASVPEGTKGEYLFGLGRRKTSIARVKLIKNGKGKITINGKAFETYFPTFEEQKYIKGTLAVVGLEGAVDIIVSCEGGGLKSQAEAARLGLSRALILLNPTFRKTLKKLGCLTRDPRAKERKKPGLRRARRAPQWSKR